jgi:membrane-associated phospholipid phosphatase
VATTLVTADVATAPEQPTVLARVAGAVARHRWGFGIGALLVAIFLVNGVPLDASALLLFGVGVLGVDSLTTKGLADTGRLFRDWGPLFGVLLFYDLTHGVAESVGMPLQIDALVEADKFMFLGEVPTVWLQDHLLGTQVAWWEVLVTLVYCSHFVAAPAMLLWLYRRDRQRWKDFVHRFLTLNAFGLATYILVPAAPPWWAAEHGQLEPVGRVLGRGWSVIGLKSAGGVMTTGQGRVNVVAAMPSLHAGYSLLIVLCLWRTARRARPLLALYPVAMGFTLVYGGEHYVIDILAGWLYAVGVMILWDWIDARRASKAVQDSEPVPAPVG